MPNEPEKNQNQANKPTIHTTHQLPIDLASKVIVKPAQSTTFRTIQQPQMRVVRLPGAGAGAQIIQTQIVPSNILKPTIPGRSTITVSKSPATYLPRVTTLNTIQGAKGTQIRTPTPPSSVAGISPAFVRTSITPRTSSPNAVLSQGTTTWVSGAGGTMQVQMPQQIIRSTMNRTITANIYQQAAGQQNSTISVTTPTSGTSGQPTFVATVLPQRPQGATIVYTSQTQPPYIQGHVQRMNVATAAANTRQIRPLQRIPQSGIRVNTSSLSIRPNVPGLAPTTILATQPRNTTGLATSISNTIPARIFQVQPTQTTGGSQVISQNNQKILSANVMLPIIVNNRLTHSVKNPLQQGILTHVGKIATGSVSSDGTIISSSLTNTIPSNTMVASIQSNQAGQTQVSQGQQGTIYSSQAAQQLTNLGNQGNQIVTVSQQQQMMVNQQGNIHQGGNVQTVVPLAMGSRNANIPIKTITVSTSNSGSLDSAVTVHRNLTSNAGNLQNSTIVPIAKLVSQQQIVNQQQNLSAAQNTGQGTPVYIHTRIPAVSTVASSVQSQVITVSSSNTNYSSSGTPTLYYEQASLSSADKSGSSNNEPTYGVASSSNVRYSDKIIHSIIASSYQNQNNQNNATHIQQQSASNQQSVPIRFSPMVVESQGGSQGQQPTHQIISMGSGNTVQQQQSSNSETTTHVIVPIQVPTSPRGSGGVLRKQNESTPVKGPKKQAKLKNYQIAEGIQVRVPPRTPISASVAQLTQNVKPVEQKLPSTASSPKTTFSERESPSHADEWSDGSTTVSIPNSPRSEEDDLDAMIQFSKIGEELGKYVNKTPVKSGSGVKREANDHPMTPRSKKIKQ